MTAAHRREDTVMDEEVIEALAKRAAGRESVYAFTDEQVEALRELGVPMVPVKERHIVVRLSDVLARRNPVWWCNRTNRHAEGDEGPDGVYCTVRLDVDPEGIRYHLASKWECHWVLIIPLEEFKEWEEPPSAFPHEHGEP